MVASEYPISSLSSVPNEPLLDDREVILLVDDYPDLVLLLKEFLDDQGMPAVTAGSAAELHQALREHHVALAVLDIGLPDGDGMALLPDIIRDYPDTSVIMLTASTDLHTAMDCMRQGADDYLTKPVQFSEFYQTVLKVLEKRRLTINNRRYQHQIEQANFRLQLLHELSMKMNSAYLSMVELDEILQAILVGITAEEGLQFNRAFLALFDESGQALEGRMAIGPGCREEAGRIWQDMRAKDLRFHEIIHNIKKNCFSVDAEVNTIVHSLKVKTENRDHLLIRAALNKQSMNVVAGRCEYPVPADLIDLLREDTFVVVPLFSPRKSLGVLIADHFVTRRPITETLVHALKSFASQASLAIEHSHLYRAMELKIKELEAVTHELEQNKDLLVEAERFAAVGHVAAQLVHNIRNPITSIGGTARLLARKTNDPEQLKFLNIMTQASDQVEAALENLFSFVEQDKPNKKPSSLYPLIHKSMMLFYNAIHKHHIEPRLILPEPGPVLKIDQRQIRQMLVHLVRNGIEAMADGGTLTIEVTSADRQVALSIRDTGSGITEPNLDRAADPFFTTKTYGTGMGLTLVRRIVKNHDGTLKVKNRDQGGTEVTVTFPLEH